ncbi:hypothetical protein ACLOJK_009047 [Asimina triloba]
MAETGRVKCGRDGTYPSPSMLLSLCLSIQWRSAPTVFPLSGAASRSYRPPTALSPSLSLHPPPETHQSPSLLLSLYHSICVEMCCLDADYDYYVKLLRLFYLADDLIPDSLESVRTALGVLQAATALCSNSISQICIEYLEAMPWEDKEEEVILKVVSGLGPSAMSILSRIQPVDSTAVKNVFISAFRFATSTDNSLPPFTNELKTSAQEQVEYMLMEDEDLPVFGRLAHKIQPNLTLNDFFFWLFSCDFGGEFQIGLYLVW